MRRWGRRCGSHPLAARYDPRRTRTPAGDVKSGFHRDPTALETPSPPHPGPLTGPLLCLPPLQFPSYPKTTGRVVSRGPFLSSVVCAAGAICTRKAIGTTPRRPYPTRMASATPHAREDRRPIGTALPAQHRAPRALHWGPGLTRGRDRRLDQTYQLAGTGQPIDPLPRLRATRIDEGQRLVHHLIPGWV